MGSKKLVIVDGANVAYVERSHEGKPKVSNLTAVSDTLAGEGIKERRVPVMIINGDVELYAPKLHAVRDA